MQNITNLITKPASAVDLKFYERLYNSFLSIGFPYYLFFRLFCNTIQYIGTYLCAESDKFAAPQHIQVLFLRRLHKLQQELNDLNCYGEF